MTSEEMAIVTFYNFIVLEVECYLNAPIECMYHFFADID